ncbi:hypothetical protein [Paraburkholderia phosphatilytica]|uniref:hypothetical protein n=1 Tax=Paraburkholderia phosphatilytica TaxID=2282883 RepID=UPI0013DEE5D6|nr:hypothetical protein [Paraburkholderia phosphatilytica]
MAAEAAQMQQMMSQMEESQMMSEAFQSKEEEMNMENGAVNSAAQFSNGLADSMKSAAK